MLKPLLTKKMLSFLRPRQDLSQFSQTDALKRGLDLAAVMWRTRFEITKRGMRRALWADDEEHIKNVSLSIMSSLGSYLSSSSTRFLKTLMLLMNKPISRRRQKNLRVLEMLERNYFALCCEVQVLKLA
jgi:hypothetical protein